VTDPYWRREGGEGGGKWGPEVEKKGNGVGEHAPSLPSLDIRLY